MLYTYQIDRRGAFSIINELCTHVRQSVRKFYWISRIHSPLDANPYIYIYKMVKKILNVNVFVYKYLYKIYIEREMAITKMVMIYLWLTSIIDLDRTCVAFVPNRLNLA